MGIYASICATRFRKKQPGKGRRDCFYSVGSFHTRIIRKTDNLHLLSTVAFLRGMQAAGLLESADQVINAMLHPCNPRFLRPGKASRYSRAIPAK